MPFRYGLGIKIKYLTWCSFFEYNVSVIKNSHFGGVDYYPENLKGGISTFENGDITYCKAYHNMAIFYAQTDYPILSVDVISVGKVTSDLAVFDTLDSRENITFPLAE